MYFKNERNETQNIRELLELLILRANISNTFALANVATTYTNFVVIFIMGNEHCV